MRRQGALHCGWCALLHCGWGALLHCGWGALLLGGAVASAQSADDPYCELTPAGETGARAPGLIVGADVLLPDGRRPDHGVHIRFNGQVGAVAGFDALRDAFPDAAVLDCRGRAVASPGFVNAHEHPAYSHAFPDGNLNPGYAHRDEWRLGAGGKVQLPSPPPYRYDPGDPESTAILIAMELRHLLGGATAIAGTGGVPGVIRNVNRHVRVGDPDIYDAEADMATFPFSLQVVEDLREECAGGAMHRFPPAADDLAFMAYVPHVGEGRRSNCAARAEVARYLQRVQRRDRRYSLVHGVATDREDYAAMREFDVTLVWSPRSNLALYGETVDIAGALQSGVRVALATDWSPSGSFNMREEVACARRVGEQTGTELSAEALWRMTTLNGAYALGLEDQLGAIGPGLRADLVLVRYADDDAYESVLGATDEDILAAWIGGRAMLLSRRMDERLSERNCVALDGVAPRVCGVLGAFGLTVDAFGEYVADSVPINGATGQAACGPGR